MSKRRKPSPMEAFELNMADAHRLVLLAEALTNQRQRRMRRELRDRLGQALRIRVADRDQLDCLHSQDAYVILLPGSRLTCEALADHRPLLRQALVAGCAATETFIADAALQYIGPLLRSRDVVTDRVKKLTMTVGTWLELENRYQRRRRGLREKVLAPYIREHASTAPSQIGQVLSMVGVDRWSSKLDGKRGVRRGESEKTLQRITERRNMIAHEGDRKGYGRATITLDEVKQDLNCLESVVKGIDRLLRDVHGAAPTETAALTPPSG